jgi:DNA-binding NarL/FixJ family response regulator
MAPLSVALRIGDPDLRAGIVARLEAMDGAVLVADEAAAELLISDAGPEADDQPVLVLAEGAAAVAALRAGAAGVLAPDASAGDLAAVLPALARGLTVVPPEALAGLLGRRAQGPSASLTRREREVLDLLAAGASNKLIARRLGLSFHTVKAHVAAVLDKLGAASRADAVARGARQGLVML